MRHIPFELRVKHKVVVRIQVFRTLLQVVIPTINKVGVRLAIIFNLVLIKPACRSIFDSVNNLGSTHRIRIAAGIHHITVIIGIAHAFVINVKFTRCI